MVSKKFLITGILMGKITREDRNVIKALRVEKNWNSRRFLKEFTSKAWCRSSLDELIKTIDAGLPVDGVIGRGRRRPVRTAAKCRHRIPVASEYHLHRTGHVATQQPGLKPGGFCHLGALQERVYQVRYQSPANPESAFESFKGQTHENFAHDVEKVWR